jgi:hypothetical protein
MILYALVYIHKKKAYSLRALGNLHNFLTHDNLVFVIKIKQFK